MELYLLLKVFSVSFCVFPHVASIFSLLRGTATASTKLFVVHVNVVKFSSAYGAVGFLETFISFFRLVNIFHAQEFQFWEIFSTAPGFVKQKEESSRARVVTGVEMRDLDEINMSCNVRVGWG
jgi:hypothetical protein